MQRWYLANEDGEYWSNEYGWTGFDECTLFTDYDHAAIAFVPEGGFWCQAALVWVPDHITQECQGVQDASTL